MVGMLWVLISSLFSDFIWSPEDVSHSCVVTVLISAGFHNQMSVAPMSWSGNSSSYWNHKHNHHKWNHTFDLRSAKLLHFLITYIKWNKWTHLNESRLGRSNSLKIPLMISWRRVSSSECDFSLLLLMSPAPVPEIWLLFNLEKTL